MRRIGLSSPSPLLSGITVVVITGAFVGAVLLASASLLWPETADVAVSSNSADVVLAAGDLADCKTSADSRVGNLIDAHAGTLLTLGDNAYPNGREKDFRECYEPVFGRHLWRTRPSLGNHDYPTDEAEPYFSYFGSSAGASTRGYYGHELGPYWYAIALNSNCDHVEGGCGAASPQIRWLERVLTENADRNILAYWHHPVFSTGEHGGSDRGRAFYETLYDAGADLVLVGHDHDYERFARADPEGRHDEIRGIRQFVVGTGGTRLRPFAEPPDEITEARHDRTHGVLRLELNRTKYSWEFLATSGSGFTDRGSAVVNGPVPRGGGGNEAT